VDILSVQGISAGYQEGIDILHAVSLNIRQGSVTVLIGPNGAGKSTLLKTIFGFLKPHAGAIFLDGQALHPLLPHQIKRLGVSYIPQGTNLFPHLTTEENLKMGGWIFRQDKARLEERLEQVYNLFPALKECRHIKATALSGGQSRMLAIAKEVITDPRLILVDEPSAGLAPNVAAQAYDFLLSTREATGASILLVDQNMSKAVEISDYVYLLNLGQVKAEGPKREFDEGRVKALIQECLLGR